LNRLLGTNVRKRPLDSRALLTKIGEKKKGSAGGPRPTTGLKRDSKTKEDYTQRWERGHVAGGSKKPKSVPRGTV